MENLPQTESGAAGARPVAVAFLVVSLAHSACRVPLYPCVVVRWLRLVHDEEEDVAAPAYDDVPVLLARLIGFNRFWLTVRRIGKLQISLNKEQVRRRYLVLMWKTLTSGLKETLSDGLRDLSGIVGDPFASKVSVPQHEFKVRVHLYLIRYWRYRFPLLGGLYFGARGTKLHPRNGGAGTCPCTN